MGYNRDKHYGDWLHIWNELTQSAGHQLGYANMVGNTPLLATPLVNSSGSSSVVPGQILYIPLEFWSNWASKSEGSKSFASLVVC